jgi:hypothetical protein
MKTLDTCKESKVYQFTHADKIAHTHALAKKLPVVELPHSVIGIARVIVPNKPET